MTPPQVKVSSPVGGSGMPRGSRSVTPALVRGITEYGALPTHSNRWSAGILQQHILECEDQGKEVQTKHEANDDHKI